MTDIGAVIATPPPAPVKPGYLTTEFWLKVVALVLTALYASGAIPTSGTAATVAAIAATILGALGYTVARTFLKNGTVVAAAALMLLCAGTQLGCATVKSDAKLASRAVRDCTRLQGPKLVAAIATLAVTVAAQELQLGKPDWDALASEALADASDIKACSIAEYKAAKQRADAASGAVALRALLVEPDPLDVAITKLHIGRGVEIYKTTGGDV